MILQTNSINTQKPLLKKIFTKLGQLSLNQAATFDVKLIFFKSTRHKIGNTWPKQNTGEASTLKLNNVGGRM